MTNDRGMDPEMHDITLINLAAAIILMHPASQASPDQMMKAASTLFNGTTLRELARLARILQGMDGFENKKIVHRNEAPDSAVQEGEQIMSSDELRNLFDK